MTLAEMIESHTPPADTGCLAAVPAHARERAPTLTQGRLQYLLDYNPETGVFVWSNPTSVRVKRGRIAGNIDRMGYVQISLDGKDYRGHRLAWLYVHGYMPEHEVDHINMNRADNRICNLREATRTQNARNRVAYKTNIVGMKGVSQNGAKFTANIWLHGKRTYLGTFDTAAEAHAKYEAVANENFGEFARAS